MEYLSVDQIRKADKRCIEELGIPGAVLMNNAGHAVFAEITRDPVGIVCGKGNNGGDGFVVARLCLLTGHDTRVVLLGEHDEVKGDALVYKQVFERLGGQVNAVTDEAGIQKAMKDLDRCQVLVDAILGTGITGEVRGKARAAIEAWPKDVFTIAVDVPSGMNADTGEIGGCCVKADVTVTLQYGKKGYQNLDAEAYLGRLEIADIDIPPVCADDEAWEKLVKG